MMINVSNAVRIFQVPVREKGIKAAMKSLIKKEYKTVEAVRNISFTISRGEIVGFLGPNGAGKTTTVKMLSGLIYPTSGNISVAGYIPYKRENEYLKSISLVMGNRRRLNWNIPVIDSFELNKEIYDIPDKEYNSLLNEFIEVMEIKELLNKPARNLSLGQRMKCEIVLAFLHRPKILFLDEPTIGLDIIAQRKIREFVKEYNKRYNATIMITSHNMSDIETLCNRVIIINHGQIIYDGTISNLVEVVSNEKVITVSIKDKSLDLDSLGKVRKQKDGKIEILISRANITEVVQYLTNNQLISDVNIQDIPIEEIIEKVFSGGIN